VDRCEGKRVDHGELTFHNSFQQFKLQIIICGQGYGVCPLVNREIFTGRAKGLLVFELSNEVKTLFILPISHVLFMTIPF